eukprot:TRINITY_DN28398_c1_g1_i3.p1 TRINITY_DN28398_c1_g1~~TRINITY_DN28398_c1_g1_i3.p1  ORF type:complete len:304 (+),score=34.39 TRINITY_DN28398_c1_g1_i3:138-914(+)
MIIPTDDEQLLQQVFQKLQCQDLIQLSLVSKAWKELSENEGIVRRCFSNTWKFKDVVGEWWGVNDLKGARVSDFVRVHKVRTTDTIMGLALKYKTETMAIRILNNMLGDSGIKAHAFLYVPVTSLADIQDKTLRFVTEPNLKRKMVLVLDDEDLEEEDLIPKMNPEAIKELQVITVQQALKIDEGTARFYLEESGFDSREAVAAFRQDEEWYQTEGHRVDNTAGPDTWYRNCWPVLACGLPLLCRPQNRRGRYTRMLN